MGKKRFKERSSSLEGIPASYNITAVFWLKILLDNAFCTRLQKAWRFLSLALSRENLQNFEERSHGLVHGILEYIYTSEKYSIIKNQPWATEKQPVERGKRAVHFRCFFIKCSNRHATGDKTNSMKSLSACVSWFKRYIYEKFEKDQELQRVLTILESGDQNLSKKHGISRPQKGG